MPSMVLWGQLGSTGEQYALAKQVRRWQGSPGACRLGRNADQLGPSQKHSSGKEWSQ